MPVSEKKGRFLVTSSDEAGPGPRGSPPAAAKQRQEKPVKRGRFLITHCLPCVPCVLPATLSDDADSLHLLAFTGGQPHPPADRSSDDSADSSTCRDQRTGRDSSSSAQQCAGPQARRVRFSEPSGPHPALCCAPQVPCWPAGTSAAAAIAAAASPAAAAPSNLAAGGLVFGQSSSLPTPLSTRSYCRGRFVVQESVISSCITRSLSMPEPCMLAQQHLPATHAAFYQQHSDGASSSSSSNSNLCSDAAAPGSLLHGRHDAAVAAAVAAAAASASYWSATSALDTQQHHQQHLQPLAPVQLAGSASCELFGDDGPAGASGPHRHHHKPPQRSQSVSYCRRGRFLVQTISSA